MTISIHSLSFWPIDLQLTQWLIMYNMSIKIISWKSHSVNLPLWAGLVSFDGWICEEVLSEVVDMWQLQDGLLTTNKKVCAPISILCIIYNYVWLPDLYLAGDAPLSVALHRSLYGVHLIIFQNWCLWYDICISNANSPQLTMQISPQGWPDLLKIWCWLYVISQMPAKLSWWFHMVFLVVWYSNFEIGRNSLWSTQVAVSNQIPWMLYNRPPAHNSNTMV